MQWWDWWNLIVVNGGADSGANDAGGDQRHLATALPPKAAHCGPYNPHGTQRIYTQRRTIATSKSHPQTKMRKNTQENRFIRFTYDMLWVEQMLNAN